MCLTLSAKSSKAKKKCQSETVPRQVGAMTITAHCVNKFETKEMDNFYILTILLIISMS